MGWHITEFETTPNPNAVKCWLDRPISDRPRSFLNEEAAAADPIARALFREAGATNVLFNGEWMTVCKAPDARWPDVQERVRLVLSRAEPSHSADGVSTGDVA